MELVEVNSIGFWDCVKLAVGYWDCLKLAVGYWDCLKPVVFGVG
jgi:hypothetical protein